MRRVFYLFAFFIVLTPAFAVGKENPFNSLSAQVSRIFQPPKISSPQTSNDPTFFCTVTPPEKFGVKKIDKKQAKLKAALLDGANRDVEKGNREYKEGKNGGRLQEIQRRSGERKRYLKELMRSDPDAALLAAAAPDERTTLLATSQNCVETPVIAEGTLEVLHADYADGTTEDDYTLHTTAGERLKIHPARGVKDELLSGTKVRVNGLRIDNDVLFDGTSSVAQPNGDFGGITVLKQVTNPPVLGDQRTVVFMVNFQNTTQPALTQAAVQDAVFTETNSYYKENSYNKMSLSGDVINWIRLPISRTCDALAVESEVIKATDALVDFRQYSRTIVIAPFSSCNWVGIATLDKASFFTQDGYVSMSAALVDAEYIVGSGALGHELGHNFGNGHAGFYNCFTTSFSGCGTIEYGDYYDVMGASLRKGHFNAPHKEFVGWLDSSNIQEVSVSGTYTIEPIETATTGLKVLKIRRSTGDYLFVEYRQPIGFDANFTTMSGTDVFRGALLHLHSSFTTKPTLLVDPTPPGNALVSVLPVGGVFGDSIGGGRVEVLAATPIALTVSVQLGMTDFTPPTATITSPTRDSSVSGSVRFGASASDASGISRVEFHFSGSAAPFAVDTAAPYEGILADTSRIPNGPFSVYVKAYDNAGAQWGVAGNEKISASVSFNLANTDASLPNIAVATPLQGAVMPNPVTFSAHASDNIGVWKVEFYEQGHVTPFYITRDGDQTAQNSFVWPVGAHQVYAKVYDFVGNSALSSTISFTIEGVDVTPPTISISSPRNGAMLGGRISVSALASDNIGIARVEFFKDADSVPFAIDEASPMEVFLDTTTLPSGTHTLYAKAYDAASNSATSPRMTVTADNVSPTVSVTFPLDGAVISGSLMMNASATDDFAIQRVDFYRDGTILLGSDTTATFNFFLNSATLINGAHTLFVRAFDAAGNSGTSPAIAISVNNGADSTPPSISITNPLSGTILSGEVGVTVSAFDSVGVARVDFYRDTNILIGTDMAAPYSASWNSALETNGQHTLFATAVDIAGNKATSTAVTITANNDKTAPVVSFSAPRSGGAVGGAVNFVLIASDVAGVARTQITGFNSVGGTITIPPDNTVPYETVLNTTDFADGTYVFYGTAVDVAGNMGTTTPLTLTLDNTPPSVELLQMPATAASGAISLTASTTDAGGLARVEFYRGTTLLGTATTSPYVFLWDSTRIANGTYIFSARAYDKAGNSAVSADREMVIENDKISPTTFIRSITPDADAENRMRIEFSATDNVAVTKVEFFKDSDSTPFFVYTNPINSSFSWDVSSVTEGNHAVWARAYDAANNAATSPTVTVRVDILKPVVAILAPHNNVLVSGVVSISATASDASGIARMVFSTQTATSSFAVDTYAPFSATLDTKTVSAGVNTVYITAYDTTGRFGVASVSINVDNILPTTSFIAPANGSVLSGEALLSAQGADVNGIARVEFYRGTTLLGTATTSPYTFLWDTRAVANGGYSLSAKAYDRAGNSAPTASVSATVNNDKTAPAVSFAAPRNGSMVSGTVSISAIASDAVGVGRVEFFKDSESQPFTTDEIAPFTAELDTRLLTVGAHTLRAKAHDEAGNTKIATITITTDNVVPSISFGAPQQDASVSGAYVSVSAVAADNVGIAKVEFYRDENVLMGADTATPFSMVWNSYTVTNGAHTLFAKAYDKAGNVAIAPPVAVTVENLPDTISPTITISAPRNGSLVKGSISVTASARDDKGLASVSFFKDSDTAPFATDTFLPFNALFDTGALADGQHIFHAAAHDGAGNRGTSTVATVIIDNTPPTILFNAPQNSAALTGIVALSVDASDANGISRVEFYRDNTIRIGSDSLAPYTYAWNTGYVSVGPHTLFAKAYDKAGNMVASSLIPVTIIR